MRLINADTIVHWQAYDDETESYPEHTGTIAELLDQITDERCPEPVGTLSMVDTKKLADYAKTGDVVPVVRCADCVRYHPESEVYGESEVWGYCTNARNMMRRKDFCSYGVRKDDEQHD